MADYAPLREGKLSCRRRSSTARRSRRGSRQGGRGGARSPSGTGDRPGWPRSWSATTRPRASTSRNKRKASEEVGMRSTITSRPASPQELLELVRAQRRRGRRDPRPAPAAGADRPRRDRRGDRPRQGRRRLTPSTGLLGPQGRPGFVPCTPPGVMRLAEAGVELGGAKWSWWPFDPRRQAARRPVAERECDRDGLPFAHRDLGRMTSRADVLVAAVGSPADRRRRDGEARGDRHRRRHQPHRGRAGRGRRLRGREGASPARSRRCRRGGPDDDRDAALEHPARRRTHASASHSPPAGADVYAPRPTIADKRDKDGLQHRARGRAACRHLGQRAVHRHVLSRGSAGSATRR